MPSDLHISVATVVLLCASAGFAACGSEATPAAECDGAAMVIGSAGGRLEWGDATLTFPPDALAEDVELCLFTESGEAAEIAFTGQVFRVTPSAVPLASRVRVEVVGHGRPEVLFAGLPVPHARGVVTSGSMVRADLDTVDVFFTRSAGAKAAPPVDDRCARARLHDARSAPPAGVEVLVGVEDCSGLPWPREGLSDLVVTVDDEPAAPLDWTKTWVTFVTVVVDLEVIPIGERAGYTAAAQELVRTLAEGEGEQRRWGIRGVTSEGPTTFLANAVGAENAVRALLDEPRATVRDLNGAIARAVTESTAAQAVYRGEQHGGVLTRGVVVVFVSGGDTSGSHAAEDARVAIAASPDHVVVTGPFGFDEAEAVAALGARVYRNEPGSHLGESFAAVAWYLTLAERATRGVAFCTSVRGGTHVARVSEARTASNIPASYPFSAETFSDGCEGDPKVSSCEDLECGGLACGTCDRGICDGRRCMSACTLTCADGVATLADGSRVECPDECDADGIPAPADGCPFLTSDDLVDLDGDGLDAPCDDDDDGDGIVDQDDACPAGETAWSSNSSSDADGDGCRDHDEDDDDDADGVADDDDACPLVAPEAGWDEDHDGCRDVRFDIDSDGDGLPDGADLCPDGAVNGCACGPATGLCPMWSVAISLYNNKSVRMDPHGGLCAVSSEGRVTRVEADGSKAWSHAGDARRAVGYADGDCVVYSESTDTTPAALSRVGADGEVWRHDIDLDGNSATRVAMGTVGSDGRYVAAREGAVGILVRDGDVHYAAVYDTDGDLLWKAVEPLPSGGSWGPRRVFFDAAGNLCNGRIENLESRITCFAASTGATLFVKAGIPSLGPCGDVSHMIPGPWGRIYFPKWPNSVLDYRGASATLTCASSSGGSTCNSGLGEVGIAGDDRCVLRFGLAPIEDVEDPITYALATCPQGGMQTNAIYHHGDRDIVPWAMQVRAGGVDVVAGGAGVILTRFEPCSEEPTCFDYDVCTADSGTPPYCHFTPIDGGVCF